MEKYIYKITNNINKKIYIGQSSNPQTRFSRHMMKHSSSKKISEDVDKYGKESFSLEIIEKCDNDFKEREKYYIKYFSDLGYELYNTFKGGEEPPTFYGESHPMSRYTRNHVYECIALLKDNTMSFNDISLKLQCSTSFVGRVNNGEHWRIDGINYPIRKESFYDEVTEKIIYDLKNTKITQKEIAKKYGVARSTVTMINIGTNRKINGQDYPIRKCVTLMDEKIKQSIINDLNCGLLNPFQISKKYNVDHSVVYRILKKIR